jgi:hypothetical protein
VKSAEVLFNEAMYEFVYGRGMKKERFKFFEKSFRQGGHAESCWILEVVLEAEDVEDDCGLREAFLKTNDPRGWYFAAHLSHSQSYDYFEKSSDAGYSWGQVQYASYFLTGRGMLYKSNHSKVILLERAASQNNPWAMDLLGDWFRSETGGKDYDKAKLYYETAASLGWRPSFISRMDMSDLGQGGERNLTEAILWAARGECDGFWRLSQECICALQNHTTADLECDFNLLALHLGSGAYWFMYGNERWCLQPAKVREFSERCLDYYCTTIDLQQKAILVFLWFWQKEVGGLKEIGEIIGKMVWEGRENCLIKAFVYCS